LEAVKDALNKFGVQGMTVSQVMGCGLQGGRTEVYRGHEYSINLLPKVKVEIVIRDDSVARIIDIIKGAARTGEIGDGKYLFIQWKMLSASVPEIGVRLQYSFLKKSVDETTGGM
jgi:nitrogen regulatory protein PII